MTTATNILRHEHEFILQLLGSFESFLETLNENSATARNHLLDYLTFFKEFADRCHHGKEEERLFKVMNELGFSYESDPLAVMLSEHNEGRGHVRELFLIANKKGSLNQHEVREASRLGSEYISLLRAHIQKENNVLFVMAEQQIPASKLEQLGQEFEDFEERVMGPGTHEKLHAIAEKLIGEFHPKNVEYDDSCAGCGVMSCGNHNH